MNKKKDRESEAPSFEEAMADLDGIVRKLEQGSGSLDDALGDYSRAIELLKLCNEKLDRAERTIEVLCGFDAEGNPITEPVEISAESLEEKRQTRSDRRSAKRRSPGTKNAVESDDEESSLF